MSISPTQRQLDLLQFIAWYQHENGGVSPTFSKCAHALQTGKSTISHLLESLEERGLIQRLRNRQQAIQILDRAEPVSHAPDGAPLFLVPARIQQRFVGGKWGRYLTFAGAQTG